MSTGEKREVVIRMLRRATIVRILPSLRKTLLSVHERWSWTYVTVVLRSVNHSYVGKVLNDGQMELPGVLTKRFVGYEEVENGRGLVSIDSVNIRCGL